MIPILDASTIWSLIVGGFITFFFGVLTGVTTHFIRRELDKRVAGWERRKTPRGRRGPRARKNTALVRLQRILTPLLSLLPLLVIVIFIGSYWMFLGYMTTLGVIAGFRWTNQ